VNILPANTRLVQLVDGAGKRCLSRVSGGADVGLLLAAQLGFEFLFLAQIFCSPELQQFWRQWRLQESNSEIPTAPTTLPAQSSARLLPGDASTITKRHSPLFRLFAMAGTRGLKMKTQDPT